MYILSPPYFIESKTRAARATAPVDTTTQLMVFSPQHEAWRKHPMLQVRLTQLFPGLGYATAIFGTYCALEWFYLRLNPPKSHH